MLLYVVSVCNNFLAIYTSCNLYWFFANIQMVKAGALCAVLVSY